MVTPEQVNAANRALYWINLFKPWALAFVAMGVAYEFVADRLERPYTKLLDTAHDEELAQLRTSGDSLRRDMAASVAREREANARIAEAQRGAAEAEARAAEANLALERFKAPRMLSAEQQRRMKAALIPFPGIPYELAVDPVPEAISLLVHRTDSSLY